MSVKGYIMLKYIVLFSLFTFSAMGCNITGGKQKDTTKKSQDKDLSQMSDTVKLEKAIFAGGCFWCVEAIYQDIKGVEKVESGYTGGTVNNPSYEQVCSGNTGHAEAVQITFDPAVITYEQLLTVFFHVHDPTTLNRQGADAGTQYRSAIFYLSDEQKKSAEKVKDEITKSALWDEPIVTEITKAGEFYSAEDYHQDYFTNNPEKSYCSIVIAPKVKKFYKEFGYLLKEK